MNYNINYFVVLEKKKVYFYTFFNQRLYFWSNFTSRNQLHRMRWRKK